MSVTAQILLVGIGSYGFRVSFIALASRAERVPPRVETALSMIAPSVLAAIVADSLLFAGDEWRGFDEWHVALAVTTLIAWRTKSIAACLAVGMALVWLLAL